MPGWVIYKAGIKTINVNNLIDITDMIPLQWQVEGAKSLLTKSEGE